MIITAHTIDEACRRAESEEHTPATEYTDEEREAGKFPYFDFGGDGTTAATVKSVQEITEEQMQFLEQVGLAYRR